MFLADCQQGLPQCRKRLIIIAACRGEVLPEIPPQTHSEHPTGALRLHRSVASVIDRIPVGAPNHDLDAVRLYDDDAVRAWDETRIAPHTITTSGGGLVHPSGARSFTDREFAALQGFPLQHTFPGKNVKKLIGNAVPPSIARVLFDSVRRALGKADGVEEETHFVD